MDQEGDQYSGEHDEYGEGDHAEQDYDYEYDVQYEEGKVRALYDYTAEKSEQISFKAGDIIDIIEELEGGWWKGKAGDKEGMFPANYIEFVQIGGDDGDADGYADELDPQIDDPQIETPPAAELAPAVTPGREEKQAAAEKRVAQLEAALEEAREKEAELERELEQLKLVREHTHQDLQDMRVVRTDIVSVILDSTKLVLELEEETDSMVELKTARQTLQAELASFNTTISKDIKKGSPLEPFKADLLSKLAQLSLKLTDDDMFTGIYEKKKKDFFGVTKQFRQILQSTKK